MTIRDLPSSPQSLLDAAFTEVVDRHQNALCTFLQHLVGDVEQAYDVLQDTFYEAWRLARANIAPFVVESDESERRRWLFHVAYRKGLALIRRRHVIRWESLDFLIRFAGEPALDAVSFEDRLVEREALRTALARLKPQDRASLFLQLVQGLSTEEVGQIVGASPTVVRKRLSRAKQRLRALYCSPHPAS
jgi:RNA polymerase sigma-70 factor (ECF subfamily)